MNDFEKTALVFTAMCFAFFVYTMQFDFMIMCIIGWLSFVTEYIISTVQWKKDKNDE